MNTYAGYVRIVVEHNAVDDGLIVKRFEQALNLPAEERALQRAMEMVLATKSGFCMENAIPPPIEEVIMPPTSQVEES